MDQSTPSLAAWLAERPFRVGFTGRGDTAPAGRQVHQVHGVEIVETTSSTPETQADGMVTRAIDEVLVIKTADCLPVLLGAEDQVMALHAGWRGLAAGIVLRSAEHGVGAGWSAVIGPAICANHFEVGDEVIAAFAKTDLSPEQHAACVGRNDAGNFTYNLQKACVFQLQKLGLHPDDIFVHPACTFASEWYSYRCGDRGRRNYSWIVRKS